MLQQVSGQPAGGTGTSGIACQTPRIQAQGNHEGAKPAASFVYNMRILPIALPGMLFVLSMAGELLLAILTMGTLVIYLMINSGARRNALVAYICTFVAAQMSVLYLCLPLVWISLFNIPLMMLLNMFLGLTGGWGLLQFSFAIDDQPMLVQMVEVGLFSLYPLASVGLVTWLTAYLTSVKFAVYVAIFYGFLLLRTSLKPTRSSFHLLQPQQTSTNQILGNAEVISVLIVYLGFPGAVFFFSHFMVFLQGNITALIELVLVTFLPTFLAMFIQLRGVYEQFNITVKQVAHARTAIGLVVLVISCWLLHQSGLSAATAWFLPAVVIYTLLGFSLSKGRHYGTMSITLAAVAVVITAYVIVQVVPVDIRLPIASPYLVSLILVVNVASSVLYVIPLGIARKNQQYFSNCFIVHSLILVHTECFFMSCGFYSHFLAVFTMLVEIYLLARLRSTSSVTQHCQWLACSMHAMKIPFLLEIMLRISHSVIHFKILSCYSSIALAILMTKTLLYEGRSDLKPENVLGYLLFVAAGLFVFLVSVIQPILLQFIGGMGLMQIFLFDLCVTCITSCKLTLCNMQQHPKGFTVSAVTLFFSTLSLVIQAPVVQGLVSPWLLVMMEVAVVLQLACTCSLIKSPRPRLYAFVGGILIGTPLGVTCCKVFGLDGTLLVYVLYVFLSVETLTLLTLLWRYSVGRKTGSLVLCTRDRFVHGIFAAFVTSSVVLFVHDVLFLSRSVPLWSALSAAPATIFICFLYVTLSLSIHLFCLKWQHRDPFSYKPGLLPTYGNAVTIGAYILAVLINPLQFPEIWNSASSIILLCLQQDLWMFPNFRASMRTSTIFAICALQLLLFSLKYSILWTRELSVFAVLELLVLPVCVPSLFVMATFLSRPPKYVMPEQTVILWAPLPIAIFIFGNSYASWLLAGTSFVSGMWLLQHTSFGMQG